MTKSSKSFLSGVLFMTGSAASLSIIGLLGELGLRNFSLSGMIFWRFATAFLFSLLLLKLLGQLSKHRISGPQIRLNLLRAVLVLGSQYSFFFCIAKTNLLQATVLLNTGPLFIPLFEWIFFHKKPGYSTWIGLFVAFIGVLFILQPSSWSFISFWSVIGLLSGLCQAGSQVIFRPSSQSEKSEFGVLYLFFLCSLISAIPYLFLPSQDNSVLIDYKTVFILCGVGLASLANQSLRAEAYKHSIPSRLSPFLYFSVVLAGLWDWLFFDNLPNTLSGIGMSLVILGGALKIYLRNLKKKKLPTERS